MHPLTKWASKLYPKWWRERYGDEFAALLEDSRPGLAGALDIAKGALTVQLTTWSGKRAVLLGAVLGLLTLWGVLLTRPPQYSSEATIAAAGLNPRSMVDEINVLSQRVLTRGTLTRLIREFDMYRSERQQMPLEDILELMKRDIRIYPRVIADSQTQFSLQFQYSDPKLAKAVTTRLASGFIDANVQARETGTNPIVLELRRPASDSQRLEPAGWWKLGAIGIAAGSVLGALIGWVRRHVRIV